jgi:hypothetical protein
MAERRPPRRYLAPRHGSADAECRALLRPVRARGHNRAHPRQDRGVEEEGLWIGSPVPLGYDAKDRTVVVNEARHRRSGRSSSSIWNSELRCCGEERKASRGGASRRVPPRLLRKRMKTFLDAWLRPRLALSTPRRGPRGHPRMTRVIVTRLPPTGLRAHERRVNHRFSLSATTA